MSIVVKGKVQVWKNGHLAFEGRNRVVDSGLALIANVFSATATDRIKAIAFGTNSAAPTATQKKLSGTEKGRRPVVATTASALLTYTATIAGVSPATTLAEFGLFNSTGATGGTMLSRWPSSKITMGTGDSLKVTWSIEFGTGS